MKQTYAAYRYFGAFRLSLAMLVVIQHFFANLAPEPFVALAQPYEVGSVAVLVFFALSGFVISEAADCVYRARPAAFLANRLLRLFPHFLLAMATAVTLFYVLSALGALRFARAAVFPGAEAFALKNIFFNFLGVLPLSDRLTTFNFVDIAWAVRVEMAFYGVIAFSLFLSAVLQVATPRQASSAPPLSALPLRRL